MHGLLDYIAQIKRFGSFGNNQVQIQESFFSKCKNIYRSSNKKQQGEELASFYAIQYSIRLWKNFKNSNQESEKNEKEENDEDENDKKKNKENKEKNKKEKEEKKSILKGKGKLLSCENIGSTFGAVKKI
jgi:hypothetical protein